MPKTKTTPRHALLGNIALKNIEADKALNLRDQLALASLQGLLMGRQHPMDAEDTITYAEWSYTLADAMLGVRSRRQPNGNR